MAGKDILRGLEIDKRSGYSILDVIRLILLLEKGPLGRLGIIKELGLEEASVKTMINRLNESGFLSKTTKGQVLTKKGKNAVSRISDNVSDFFETRLPGIGPCVFVVVKNSGNKVKLGIEQRDEGMKLGVKIITLTYGARLEFPGTKERARGFESVEKLCKLDRNDAVVIASGIEKKRMKRALIGAAITLF
jgi:predicted transcriptional regulator